MIGIWNLKNGKAYYQHLIHHYNTIDLTADEINHIELEEVAGLIGQLKSLVSQN